MTDLGDGDDVQRVIQLAVAARVEAAARTGQGAASVSARQWTDELSSPH